MKKLTGLVVAVIVLSFADSMARQNPTCRVVTGITVFFPNTRGTVDSPPSIAPGFGTYPFPASGQYKSNALFRLTAGLHIVRWRTGFYFHFSAVQIGRPNLEEGSETDFEVRYSFWEFGLGNLSVVASIKNGTYTQFGGMFSDGYEFTENRWLPGIGLSANFSIFHADVQMRGWPRTIVAYGHVPDGAIPSEYGQLPYHLEPVYLNYVVTTTVSVEFNLLSF